MYYLLQNSRQRSLNGSYYWLVWSKEKRTTETETLNLNIDTEMVWAQPEPNTSKIILYDLYKINYSWPINGTVAGHWDSEGGLHYNLTQYKYLRRHDMRGTVFTAGLAVRSFTAYVFLHSTRVLTQHTCVFKHKLSHVSLANVASCVIQTPQTTLRAPKFNILLLLLIN